MSAEVRTTGAGALPAGIVPRWEWRTFGEKLSLGGDLPEILARTYDSAAFIFRESKQIDDALRASLRAHELAEQSARDRPGDRSGAEPRVHTRMAAQVDARHSLDSYGADGLLTGDGDHRSVVEGVVMFVEQCAAGR